MVVGNPEASQKDETFDAPITINTSRGREARQQEENGKNLDVISQNSSAQIRIVALLDLNGEAACRTGSGAGSRPEVVEDARSIAEAVQWAVNQMEKNDGQKIGKQKIEGTARFL